MNHRLTIRRHGRAIAMVGALVAVGATTTMALVAGIASAAPTATQPGKCIDNVNVRADASTTAKIVAVCEKGTAVTVAETRNGFVHLTNLKGWAAQEFVSVNGKTAPAPPERAATTTTPAPAASTPAATAPNRNAPAARTPGTSGNQVGNPPATADPAADDQSGYAQPAGGQSSGGQNSGDQGSRDSGYRSPTGGLLGG